MLVSFMVKNFLSFKDETVLDFRAVNAYKEHQTNLIDIGQDEKYIKVTSIYGANASGKSNLHFAMEVFQRIIVESFNNENNNKIGSNDNLSAISKGYKPFLFDKDNENTEFEIIFIVDDFEYKYGFEYNNKQIEMEWLYRKNLTTKSTSTIVERTTENILIGSSVKDECDVYKEQIPKETLALSFFNRLKLKTDVFNIVYDEIIKIFIAPTELYEDVRILKKLLSYEIDENKHQLLEFLNAIDTGIKDIYYEENGDNIDFFTTHIDKNQNKYKLELFEESEGTIKSICLFIFVQVAISNEAAVFIDELNSKLHPLLLKFIVDLFYNENSKAQLIYTTHDTTLLDKRFSRRDQIWFVEKDEYGYSSLVSLADYKVRLDASFEKDYLSGVYGGIPNLKDFEMQEGE